jgi:uncharacterized DUF497 family protein
MEFEWDEAKSETCFAQRGFDFAYVLRVFTDPNRLIGHDRRWDYGEERYQVLGMIEQRLFHVVYTRRGARMRIISARKANEQEAKLYENGTREA